MTFGPLAVVLTMSQRFIISCQSSFSVPMSQILSTASSNGLDLPKRFGITVKSFHESWNMPRKIYYMCLDFSN